MALWTNSPVLGWVGASTMRARGGLPRTVRPGSPAPSSHLVWTKWRWIFLIRLPIHLGRQEATGWDSPDCISAEMALRDGADLNGRPDPLYQGGRTSSNPVGTAHSDTADRDQADR
jgi:hypothetical protein